MENVKVLDFLPPNTQGWYARRRMAWLGQGYDGLLVGSDVVVAFFARQSRLWPIEAMVTTDRRGT